MSATIMSNFSAHGSKEIKGGGDLATIALHDEEDGFEMRSRSSKLRGTEADERDMEILGRKQQLNASRSPYNSSQRYMADLTVQRNFDFISILGFACTLMSTWEITLV